MADVPRQADDANDPVRVMVVDDADVFRGVLCDLVRATGGMVIAGEAQTGEEALELVDGVAPQLVIMDMQMPGLDGIETARRLTDRHPGTVVLLISATLGNAEALRSSGAAAFLLKQRLSPAALRAVWREHGAAQPRSG